MRVLARIAIRRGLLCCSTVRFSIQSAEADFVPFVAATSVARQTKDTFEQPFSQVDRAQETWEYKIIGAQSYKIPAFSRPGGRLTTRDTDKKDRAPGPTSLSLSFCASVVWLVDKSPGLRRRTFAETR